MQGAEAGLVEAASSGDLTQLDLPEKEKRLMQYVHLLTVHSYKNTPEQTQILRDAGWTDAEIRETVLVVGMFSMFNRVADAFGLEDPDYFSKAGEGQGIKPATRPS